ncbi:hypothetical protein OIU74_023054 [Salix koriyanagi]|uniref:Uncharacterized protein n=1 Tax=Salix koriyanagi TaxID=2511006 RepID=A0A9Q1AAP6_9ROSI|nr:hypothetical protein OIU74_023054 [Salix koriyanagi]
MMQIQIGNGADTHLWHDPWLTDGLRLIEDQDPSDLYPEELPWNAMVSSIITNNNWNLPDILHRWRGRIGQPNMDENDHSTAEKSEEILSTIRLKLASVEDRHTITNEVLAQWGIDLQRDSGLREEN